MAEQKVEIDPEQTSPMQLVFALLLAVASTRVWGGDARIDENHANQADVVILTRLISTEGGSDKYRLFHVRVLRVIKAPGRIKKDHELEIAAYSSKPGVPDGESMLYLRHYNVQTDTGLWTLIEAKAPLN